MFEMPADRTATKQRVVAAASALFAERGFQGTTARDIAQRAGVNLAAGHYHFGSKETLYLEVLRAQFADIMPALEQRGARLTAGRRLGRAALRELLRARVTAMLALLLGPPPALHGTLMMREMCDPSAALPDIVDQFIQPQKRELEEIIAALAPTLGRQAVERCTFSIVGQVFFYRTMLPALRLMVGLPELDRVWLRTAAEHITEFSLGGMQRLAAGQRRPRRGARRTR
jgi:TetR/AcrR family transcriptional regulator, regulator of cefoperazone and chloramphenicol sensitivity